VRPSCAAASATSTQAPSVSFDLTARENLDYSGASSARPQPHRRGARSGRPRAARRLVVRSLSGGERSRISLASALLGGRSCSCSTKPTVGLDPVLRRRLWNTFHRLAEEGATLLVSSHVMDEAERCDFLILLRDGLILAEAEPDALRRRTGQTDLEEAFLVLVEAQ